MEELYVEGLALHGGPESRVATRGRFGEHRIADEGQGAPNPSTDGAVLASRTASQATLSEKSMRSTSARRTCRQQAASIGKLLRRLPGSRRGVVRRLKKRVGPSKSRRPPPPGSTSAKSPQRSAVTRPVPAEQPR
jgi:hypothetical protein